MLLESKFFQPRPRQDVVVRPRLLLQLNTGLQRKLILVLAQAGFGKTTLVAHWLDTIIQEAPTPPLECTKVTWLSLDENDNDPLRFFDYLITALQRVDAKLGEHARHLLSAPQPSANLEPLVISLINDLTNLPGHLVLALDDYHTISSQEVHQAIHTVISHAPDRFHLLLISRTEPPLPLTRLRMHRELVEIREHDLRFTLDEAMTYLLETMHCTISQADVAALEQRTEGWIVGLHLAALSLQSRPDAAAFIAEFTGNHAYIVDYLTEEVLQRQPPDIQEFLFQTSLLTRFCGPLCDAVMGRTGSQKVLEYLERSHLFVISLDNERGWYRYHHLFAEMLRRRAQDHALHHGADAYRRATEWHLKNGLALEAIDYALAADSDYAAQLIEQNLAPLVARGQFVTLRQWLSRLPLNVLRERPLLCATRARLGMRQHELDVAEKWLGYTQSALEAQPVQDLAVAAEAYAIRVDLALNRGRLAETIQLANEALAQIPQEFEHARGEILFFQGIAYYWESQYVEAIKVTAQAGELAMRVGDAVTAIYALTNQARFLHTQGKMHESVAALDQTWAVASARNAEHLPILGSYHNNMGQVLYEWNQLDAAEEHHLQAIYLSEQARNPRTAVRGYSLLLPVYQAKGQDNKADEMAKHVLQLIRQNDFSVQILDECSRTIILKWLNEGNLAAVAEWFEMRKLPLELPLELPDVHSLEHEYFLLARYWVARNDMTAALDLITKSADSAHALGKLSLYAAIRAYHALLLHQLGDGRAAFTWLNEVLEFTEPQGYIRTFLDEGKPMLTLLTAIQPRLGPKMQAYVRHLLQAFGQPAAEPTLPAPGVYPTPTAHSEELFERLSERELEVLRLVDEGLSDSQIAGKLILAVGTVKRHLNNIYGKLGVHNRTHALARARTLKLL